MAILDLKASLHNHSIWSMLDGASTVEEYLKMAQERGCEYFALTEHGMLSGMHQLMTLAPKYGVKPVLGNEMYVDLRPDLDNTYGHITLLAYNDVGKKNLLKLFYLSWDNTSRARWGKKKPMISFDQLEEYNAGLFAGTGCLVSTLARPLLKGRPDLFDKNLDRLISIFGKHRLFAEAVPHAVTHDWDHKTGQFEPNECSNFAPDGDILKAYNKYLWDKAVIGKGLKPGITLDAHFCRPEQKEIQNAILRNGESGWTFHSSYHWLQPEEIYNNLSYLSGHNEKLHEQMIMTTYEMCQDVRYSPEEKQIYLPFKYDSVEAAYSDVSNYIKEDVIDKICKENCCES